MGAVLVWTLFPSPSCFYVYSILESCNDCKCVAVDSSLFVHARICQPSPASEYLSGASHPHAACSATGAGLSHGNARTRANIACHHAARCSDGHPCRGPAVNRCTALILALSDSGSHLPLL